jgi:AmmeMemoRadiSam system protein B
MSEVRAPAVAGQFYERSPRRLEESLRDCFHHRLGPGRLPEVNGSGPGAITALVSPHAGYVFSGPAAAHGYVALAADGIPEAVIVLGPSHHFPGHSAAISTAAAWATPLGEAPVDDALRRKLLAEDDLFAADERTHMPEHSLEVQVPFLQFTYRDRLPPIVPVCLRAYPLNSVAQAAEGAKRMGEAIARAISGRRVALIASTDLSHHFPYDEAQRRDQLALDAIRAMDPARLLQAAVAMDIRMCGHMPVAVAMHCCLARGPHAAELFSHYTSGDIIEDRSAVVGYASLALRAEGGGVS